MSADTKPAQGRRELHYGSLDDLLADAEYLVAGDVEMQGNWGLGQILTHLGKAFETCIDGSPFRFPAPVRWIGARFLKRKFLTRPLPSGFKVPKSLPDLRPDTTPAEEGLAVLKHAIDRLKTEQHRELHPLLGPLTVDEWNEFHLRHAELHMSFAVPVNR